MLKTVPLDIRNPSPAAAALVDAWQDPSLKVFVLKANAPPENVKELYDRLLPALGTPAMIAEDVRVGDRANQRTGGLWMEVRYDPQFPDAYRHSANAQPLHTDGSYIPDYPNSTLMTCEANAGEGGETTFLDSTQLIAALRAEAPGLLEELYATVVPHARSGDRRECPVIRTAGERTLLNWNYYCVDPQVAGKVAALREKFQEFLLTSPLIKANTLAVKLQRGDGVTWKDEEILHGRNSFNAAKVAERFLWKCAINIGRWS